MSESNKENKKEKNKVERTVVLIPGKPPLYVDERLKDAAITELASELKEQASLMRGVGIGLLMGIIGNLFVSHYYSAFSTAITYLLDEGSLLTVNIVLAFVYLAVILLLSWLLYISVTGLEDVSSRLRSYVRQRKSPKHLEEKS